MLRIVRSALYLVTLTLIASCGGGGGGSPSASGPSTTSISGVALDGYLYNASVFLDLNGNGQFDAGEPSATTNSSGGYTLNATQDQLNSHSVIVFAQAGVTIDQDTPNTPITSAMTLIAPAGAPTVVSPITTHVAAKMASGLTLDQAKAATQSELGISASEVLSDFLSVSGSGSDVHKVATAIAEVLKTVESSSSSSTTVAAKLNAIGSQVGSQVTNNISAIKQASSAEEAKQIFQNVNQSSNIYTVGGTISGLRASGLVLTNGLSNVRPSSSATSFTFPLKQAANSSYSVSVSTNPEGQTCTVSNGSGTITTSSITNVSVTCQQTPGQLSGTISGLTTSGLKLTNGSEEITISSGATTFAFSNRVAAGSSYSASVSAQPTGKTCSISNATGTMTSSGVNNVQVTCANLAYTLGGSISGLSTSGLRLKNGSETIDISSSSTSYVFPTSVAYGGSYQIEVARQPTGQTCSISSGSGHMGTSNVTSVNLSCSTNTYSISGTITGVTKSGITLTLGNETLQIQPNATSFQFSNKIAYGSNFVVSSNNTPSGFSCSMQNSSGVVTTDVTNIKLSCTYIPNIYVFNTYGTYVSDHPNDLVAIAYKVRTVKSTPLPEDWDMIAVNYSGPPFSSSNFGFPATLKVGDKIIVWNTEADKNLSNIATQLLTWEATPSSPDPQSTIFTFTPGVNTQLAAPFDSQIKVSESNSYPMLNNSATTSFYVIELKKPLFQLLLTFNTRYYGGNWGWSSNTYSLSVEEP